MTRVELMTLVSLNLKASLILGLTLLALPFLRKASAAHRRLLLLFGVVAALLFPLTLALPKYPIADVTAGPAVVRIVAEALSSESARPPARAATTLRSGEAPTARSLAEIALGLWALGTALFLLRLASANVRARRLVSRATLLEPSLGTSHEVATPVVVGWFHPVVLLPPAAGAWSNERRRAVLLHERAHVQARDGLALLAAQLCAALYWFLPLSWLALRELRRECELAADETALAAGILASDYAEHLLAIARLGITPTAGIAMASRPSELARRITSLLARKTLPAKPGRTTSLVFCALGASAVALIACAGVSRSSASPTPHVAPSLQPDERLQKIVAAEALDLREAWGSERVAIVILASGSAELLAVYDDKPREPVVPASTLKPFVMAAALENGKVRPEQRFDCGNGERDYNGTVLHDAGNYGSLSADEILSVSSNIGMSRIFDALGGEAFQSGLERFHLKAPRVETGSFEGAVTAIGQRRVWSTPLEMAAAYAVFANEGVYRAPAKAARTEPGERVIRAETARAVRTMLEHAVGGERATGKGAQLAGVRVAGKTGTSDDSSGIFASFVGIVPADAPRYVIYVGVGAPKREGSGATIAAPAFARIASRALTQ
jgi:cell division protein FtsI (penicillin-binding protein 3)